MIITTEAKAQGWRAIAVFTGGSEALLYVGRSSTQVRGGYAEAFNELLESDEQEQITAIKLQQWQGAPDAGKWQDKSELRLPNKAKQTARMAA